MEEIVFNAENLAAGRLASAAAKELLKGREVRIVNAEKALVNGDPKYTKKIFKEKIDRGDPYNGPFYPKTPDRIMKRMVRGMLPRRKPMGRKAFKRLKAYISVPEELQDREFSTLPKSGVGSKSITLEALSNHMRLRK